MAGCFLHRSCVEQHHCQTQGVLQIQRFRSSALSRPPPPLPAVLHTPFCSICLASPSSMSGNAEHNLPDGCLKSLPAILLPRAFMPYSTLERLPAILPPEHSCHTQLLSTVLPNSLSTHLCVTSAHACSASHIDLYLSQAAAACLPYGTKLSQLLQTSFNIPTANKI